MRTWRSIQLVVVLAVLVSFPGIGLVATASTAPTPGPIVHTGEMGDTYPDARYPVVLRVGQEVRVSAVATSGDLDPYLGLSDPAGAVVAENDDRDDTTFDSYLVHAAAVDGEHVVIVSNISGTAGAFTVTIEVGESAAITDAMAPLEYSGSMSDEVPEARYPFTLDAGRAVRITTDTVSGDLDPIIWIEDADGQTVALNDDGDYGDLDSDLAYVSPTSATYTLVVSNISPTSGDYRVTLNATDPATAMTVGRVTLSGPALVHDTTGFRIHYTTEGEDATTLEFAQLVGTTLEDVLRRETGLGWPLPPPDGAMGGDARFDVYLVDVLTDDEETELGHVAAEPPGRDNANTAVVEDAAAPSYIVLDNDFGQGEVEPGEDGVALMHATAAHEFHHSIQAGYDFAEPMLWYGEATASWMETIVYPDFEAATGYVESLFEYPELCLGVQGDADPTDGTQKYGEWLFLQSLVDTHDPELVVQLWEGIGAADDWAPLDTVLASYEDTRVDAVRRFRLQNLVRDYTWTPEFVTWTVWREKTIDAAGQWTHDSEGVQQLGANYFGVNVPPGSYQFVADDPALELWLVGISGPTASVFAAHGDRVVNVSGFDFAYLMVFNPAADYDVEACQYTSYGLTVSRVGDATAPGTADFTLDATQFAPLS